MKEKNIKATANLAFHLGDKQKSLIKTGKQGSIWLFDFTGLDIRLAKRRKKPVGHEAETSIQQAFLLYKSIVTSRV